MQGLLIGDHIQAFIEIIFLLAIYGRGYIPRGIKAGAVLFNYNAGGHGVIVQFYHLRALAFFQQPLLFQFGHYRLPFILIKAFSGIGIKGYAQKGIYAGYVPQGNILKPCEDFHGLPIVVLNFLEPGAGLVLQGLVSLLIEADVKLYQFVYAGALHLLAAAPKLIGADELAELSAPVAQMVNAYAFIAQEIIKPVEGMAQGGGGEMPDMAFFRDIYGGIIYAYGFICALVRAAVSRALFRYAFQNAPGAAQSLYIKIEIAAGAFYSAYKGRLFNICGQLGRDGLGRLAHNFGQFKAGQGVIAHFRLRGDFQKAFQLFGRHAGSLSGQICDFLFIIHNLISSVKRARADKRGPSESYLFWERVPESRAYKPSLLLFRQGAHKTGPARAAGKLLFGIFNFSRAGRREKSKLAQQPEYY